MYKEGFPEIKTYKGFSVGDIVSKGGRYNSSLGQVVRIYKPPYDDFPYIEIKWMGNGSVGVHYADNLELYKTHAQWMVDIQKQ